MKGAPASLARRREISVLPTPVGPIIRMFLGCTSSRSFSSSCRRRQRLRNAMATARLASFWPMMKRSSSETISRGEKVVIFGPAGSDVGGKAFEGDMFIGVHTDVGGDGHRLLGDGLGVHVGFDKRAGGGEGVVAAGADAHDARLGLEHVAGAGKNQAGRVAGG